MHVRLSVPQYFTKKVHFPWLVVYMNGLIPIWSDTCWHCDNQSKSRRLCCAWLFHRGVDENSLSSNSWCRNYVHDSNLEPMFTTESQSTSALCRRVSNDESLSNGNVFEGFSCISWNRMATNDHWGITRVTPWPVVTRMLPVRTIL